MALDWNTIRKRLFAMPLDSKEAICGVDVWRTSEHQWNVSTCDVPLPLHEATCEVNTARRRLEGCDA